ncbi:VOC family protein [Actinokineospora sp.]|uniref:VOC family protein n=1 Tax=Actinokineospora sp. TaxID=1872133 RepID=UPI00403819ED
MSVKRIVPDLTTERPAETRAFYTGLLGLDVAMDLGWVATLVSASSPASQIIIMDAAEVSDQRPDMSVEVDDVDAVHARAVELGLPIAYALRDEPWGVRRFFVADPDGRLVNVLSHRVTAP